MSALPFPTYGLDKLYLFPVYNTRDDYQKAAGVDAPAFNASRPPKYWFDPSAKDSKARTLVYNNVLATADNGQPLSDANGNPYLENLVLYREDAAAVNIPPTAANVPGADVPPIPTPLRALDPEEELYFGLGGYVAVRNKTLAAEQDVTFSADDRRLLQAIAAKLGVQV